LPRTNDSQPFIRSPIDEAPEWVRDAWIGVSIPLLIPSRRMVRGFGVLTGPRDAAACDAATTPQHLADDLQDSPRRSAHLRQSHPQVRDAWIGVSIPLLIPSRRMVRGFGVLTGPRGVLRVTPPPRRSIWPMTFKTVHGDPRIYDKAIHIDGCLDRRVDTASYSKPSNGARLRCTDRTSWRLAANLGFFAAGAACDAATTPQHLADDLQDSPRRSAHLRQTVEWCEASVY
jgi:hypothetical protein